MVSGFVPLDLKGYSLQAVVTRVVDGGLIFKSTALTCTGKVTCNVLGMGTIVSLDITSCFLEGHCIIFARLEIGFVIAIENVRICDCFNM